MVVMKKRVRLKVGLLLRPEKEKEASDKEFASIPAGELRSILNSRSLSSVTIVKKYSKNMKDHA